MALTVAQRAANYYAQKYRGLPGDGTDWRENPPQLTGPQRRRIKHKRGHQINAVVRGRIRRAQRG